MRNGPRFCMPGGGGHVLRLPPLLPRSRLSVVRVMPPGDAHLPATVTTMTTTAAEHAFVWESRCDACGQRATHQATRAGGKRLQMCAHHEHISAAGLIAQGFIVTSLAVKQHA